MAVTRLTIAPADAEFLCAFEVPARDGPLTVQAYHVEVNHVHTYLISGGPIENDDSVYSPDPNIDGPCFFFFSLAALELAKKLAWRPDILHANDWHTALAVYALKLKKQADPFFKDVRSILGIHNLPFMGAGTEAAFDDFGLPPSRYPRLPWWARKLPLPLGLQTADRIVAVSPTYAQEILTPEYGCGLEKMLRVRRHVISGIVNGLDQERWDPAKDFDAASLRRRSQNKVALLQEFSLDPNPRTPLLILVSRMDQQKGVDLVIEGLRLVIEENWQAILLGSGDPKLEEASICLEKDYPQRVRAAIRFDANLSRRMYAGGDILLMPSRYEPCGLAQLMAMRYGGVPLARATGGLKDTIIDVSNSPEYATGFLFKSATAQAFAKTLQEALLVYMDGKQWAAIQRRGMLQDYSWENSASQYMHLYQEILS